MKIRQTCLKYLRPIDYLLMGFYIFMIIYCIAFNDIMHLAMFIYMAMHYFPLVILLRKHGYIVKTKNYEFIMSEKGKRFTTELFKNPIVNLLHKLFDEKFWINLVQLVFLTLVILAVVYLSLVMFQILTLLFPFLSLS